MMACWDPFDHVGEATLRVASDDLTADIRAAMASGYATDEPHCHCPVSTPWETRRFDYRQADPEFGGFEQRTCGACIASLSRVLP